MTAFAMNGGALAAAAEVASDRETQARSRASSPRTARSVGRCLRSRIRLMPLIERRESNEPVKGVERALEVRLGAVGGFELRPTRIFLWSGEEREGRERVVSLGSPPRSLDLERRERE